MLRALLLVALLAGCAAAASNSTGSPISEWRSAGCASHTAAWAAGYCTLHNMHAAAARRCLKLIKPLLLALAATPGAGSPADFLAPNAKRFQIVNALIKKAGLEGK